MKPKVPKLEPDKKVVSHPKTTSKRKALGKKMQLLLRLLSLLLTKQARKMLFRP